MKKMNIEIPKYISDFFDQMNDLYEFEGKDIAFISMNSDYNNALALSNYGINSLVYISRGFNDKVQKNKKITLLSDDINLISLIPDKSFDLIIGMEILEHIKEPSLFFKQMKRVLKNKGDIELQGNPMWACRYGHHIWIDKKYVYSDTSNPFENWEYLLYPTKTKMKNALIKKGFSKDDCKEIAEWIFNQDEINRCTTTELFDAAIGQKSKSKYYPSPKKYFIHVEVLNTDDYLYVCKRFYNQVAHNDFYAKATKMYSELDLNTEKCVIKIKSLV